MRIGTDVCLKTCIKEGYLMAEFKKRRLYPNGKFDPNAPMRFIQHVPKYLSDDLFEPFLTDVTLTSDEVWQYYVDEKEAIDLCCGFEHGYPQNEYDTLSIANDINMYSGLR